VVEAGIEEIVIVTRYHNRSIEDHFDNMSADLRANLKQGGKQELLEATKKISDLANFAYVRQKGPYGSATPVMNVAHLIGNEPFIYTYADDLIVAQPNRFKKMIDLYAELGGIILPCLKITRDEDFERYGILSGELIRDNVLKMDGLVEKPGRGQAPSDFASIGGYLLTPDVFDYIDKALPLVTADKEFYMTDYVLRPMMEDGKQLFGCSLSESRYYDTGNKLEYMKTVVDFALKHEDIKDDFADYLRQRAAELP
jgi:UTP--glucose-1-phosphate uridylyltransferase